MTIFSERFKELRLGKKLAQTEIAKILNVSNGTVGLWETGKRLPSYEVLVRIANFFDVTTDFLLGRVDY